MKKWMALGSVGAMMVLASGCGRSLGRPSLDQSTAQSKRLPNVPFFADSTDQCGPSTLASVLTYWNRPTAPQELRHEMYIPKLKGTLPMDLLPAVQARGLHGEVFSGDLQTLKSEIRAGRPLVAYLNYGFSFYPAGHYVVVTGFDDDRRGVFAHSGKEKDSFIPYRRFLKHWNKTDRWALRVKPREEEKRP